MIGILILTSIIMILLCFKSMDARFDTPLLSDTQYPMCHDLNSSCQSLGNSNHQSNSRGLYTHVWMLIGKETTITIATTTIVASIKSLMRTNQSDLEI